MATRASIHQRSSRKRHFSSLKTHRLARGCLYQIAKRVDFDLQACEENIRSGVECEETYPKNMIDLPPSLTEHEEIESFAYRLYEDEGNPNGRADEHWARAEQFIHAERLAIASSSEKSDIIQSVASD
jgi:Protein of unknown function (DUF2934)